MTLILRLTFVIPWLIFGIGCQTLKGGHLRCTPDKEGEEIVVQMVGQLTVRCKCIKGILESCQYPKSDCDKLVEGCHFLMEVRSGMCTKTCQDCQHYEDKFASGQMWLNDTRKPCLTNHCFSGVITQSQVQCPAPLCHGHKTLKGNCCPSCPSCQRGSMKLEEGQTVKDNLDPCTECTCKSGHLTCQRKTCPVLPCKDEYIVQPEGQCCPICSQSHNNGNQLNGKCIFKGRVYYPGSTFSPDNCSNCTCTSSFTVLCQRQSCPVLPCGKVDQILSPDQCCPTCIQTNLTLAAKRPDHCIYQGNTYQNGQAWKDQCTGCMCIDGETKCTLNSCPALNCHRNAKVVKKEGSCCPECQLQDGVCTVFGDPHYKTFDGRVFNFQGSCKYLLSRECNNEDWDVKRNSLANSTFSIRITNDARDAMAFSWLRTITVRVDGLKVSLMQNMKVKVNGKRVPLPFIELGALSIMKEGYRIVVRTNAGKEFFFFTFFT